jgi:hypothetical protein
MSVIEERNAEILRPQLKLIAQGRSRVLDVPPEVGNRDRVSIKTLSSTGQRIAGMIVIGCYPQKMGSARRSR